MGPLGTYDFTNPISLSDFFPSTKTTAVSSNTMHLYYTTCAQGKNIMVIVQVYGIRISDAVMNIVKTAYNSVSTIFTPYGSPSSDVSFSPIPGAIDEAGFRTRIKYGYNLGETVVTQPPPSSADLVEAVDAYKCVPFDPDSQVDENGKIRINTATGELYSNVAVDREALKEEAKSLPGILSTAEKYVHGATTGLGIFIATTVFLILIYVLVWGGGGIGADENAGFFQRLALWFVKFIEKIFTPIVFIVTAGFIGIIIGATMF
jgi:hypothetical protein